MSYFDKKTVLVTGGAGFIGFHFAQKLMQKTDSRIIIVDNINDYYSVKLKRDRLSQLGIDMNNSTSQQARITFYEADITDIKTMNSIFKNHTVDIVVHLAAQAGVRHAKENPRVYIESNIVGHFNILNLAATYNVDLCLYASSSSVYGNDSPIPFKENADALTPLSIYAATKLSCELVAKTYSQSSGLHCVGLRLFNVYGPWGRPDMAYYSWANALCNKLPVTIHGQGKMMRDMTYVDDVTESAFRLIEHYASNRSPLNPDGMYKNHEIFNVGSSSPTIVQEVFDYLNVRFGPLPVDMISQVSKGEDEADRTWADTTKLMDTIGFVPYTDIRHGLEIFAEWYESYALRN